MKFTVAVLVCVIAAAVGAQWINNGDSSNGIERQTKYINAQRQGYANRLDEKLGYNTDKYRLYGNPKAARYYARFLTQGNNNDHGFGNGNDNDHGFDNDNDNGNNGAGHGVNLEGSIFGENFFNLGN